MKKVLIIEDDERTALGLKIRLGRAGFDVDTATDGESGLAQAIETQASLVITDIRMPRGGGFLVASGLKQAAPGVPLIFITAYTEPGLKQKAMEFGPAAFFEKPYDANDLLGAVRRALEIGPVDPAPLESQPASGRPESPGVPEAGRGGEPAPGESVGWPAGAAVVSDPDFAREFALDVQVLSDRVDIERFDRLLAAEHFLGARRPSGHSLRQVVVGPDGEWMALALWVGGYLRLQGRDRWVGWDPGTRAERLKLVVHNARFLVPADVRRPNLEAQAMMAALRALPEQWRKRFGYAPLLAETITDPTREISTCFLVTGWTPVGVTRGRAPESESPGAETRLAAARPKRLWVRPLHPAAVQRLCEPRLRSEHQVALNSKATVRCVLTASMRSSLMSALRRLKDPRAREGRRYPLGAVLTIVAMELLRGAKHLSTIHRAGQKLDQGQRAQLGLRFKPGSHFRRAPGYFVYRDLLHALDANLFVDVMAGWVQENAKLLPRTLLLDRKTILERLRVVMSSNEPAPEEEEATGPIDDPAATGAAV